MKYKTKKSLLLNLEGLTIERLDIESKTLGISRTQLITKMITDYFERDSLDAKFSIISRKLSEIESKITN
jgi:hypothetical protein